MKAEITVFDWERMLLGDPPLPYMLENGLKILIIFAILLLVLRLLGKHSQQNESYEIPKLV